MQKLYKNDGTQVSAVMDATGKNIDSAYDASSAKIWQNGLNFDNLQRTPYKAITLSEAAAAQIYEGGYIELQPDSWDGSTPVTGDIVSATDATAWGFPWSLSQEAEAEIKAKMLSGGDYGVRYIRFPLGFGYRGSRNIDSATGLAKNIGERWQGQNERIAGFLAEISEAGGGLAPEYWCPAPYWLTGGAYYNESVPNELTAGGEYPRETRLADIKATDAEQYAAQIDAFTDAVVDDLEYLHANVAPVRMFGLEGEPAGKQAKYGKMGYDAQTYNDVLEVLWPKILSSSILSTWGGAANAIKLHVASSNETPPFDGVASIFITNHAEWIWGYSNDAYITRINATTSAEGAQFMQSESYQNGTVGDRDNVFICEYEYFGDAVDDDRRCGNNMQRMLHELSMNGAKVVMPIIHVCKPAGQTSYDTNTRGYCVYATDMATGNVEKNQWAYRSWELINDNLPIGAQIIKVEQGAYTGIVVAKNNGKLIILMALGYTNYTAAQIDITFDKERTFQGRAYSMEYDGEPMQPKTGKTITFKVPAGTGIAWIEE